MLSFFQFLQTNNKQVLRENSQSSNGHMRLTSHLGSVFRRGPTVSFNHVSV